MDTRLTRSHHRPVSQRSRLTWSPSVTLTLTHDCPWHCAYCGFRTDREGLISDDQADAILAAGRAQGALEVLLISGEHPATLPHIRRELRQRGCADFTDFAIRMARRVIAAGLLPHGNYGALSPAQLRRLRPVHASMGVMLENIQDDSAVAPEKRARGRLATIAAAGRLRIPFTSGILIGLGEPEDSRLRSLDALAALHHRYGHLQEILIQNFVPNPGSAPHLAQLPAPTLDDYLLLIRHWKSLCPDVPIQIPPNLNPAWKELLPHIDDLGGISRNRDEVNPTRPWTLEHTHPGIAAAAGKQIQRRLAVHDHFIHPDWIDPGLLPLVRQIRDHLTSQEMAFAK